MLDPVKGMDNLSKYFLILRSFFAGQTADGTTIQCFRGRGTGNFLADVDNHHHQKLNIYVCTFKQTGAYTTPSVCARVFSGPL